jgi:hypothetical protein
VDFIEQWLKRALASSTNISKLVGTIDNDDDPRIRPMTLIEQKAVREYFENEKEILLFERVFEVGRNHTSGLCMTRI